MDAVIRNKTFFAGKVEEGAMSYARLLSRLAGVCCPCILRTVSKIPSKYAIKGGLYQMSIKVDNRYRAIDFV
jgi:hypothetical protein